MDDNLESPKNPKKLPRLRKPNFSQLEETILQNEIEANLEILREKHSTSVTNAEKNKVWNLITDKKNALGVAPRTQKECRDKWRNLQAKAKSAYTDHRKESQKTGGGPPPKKPSENVGRVITMMSNCSSFTGITGGIETDNFVDESGACDEVEGTDSGSDVVQVERTRVPLSPRCIIVPAPVIERPASSRPSSILPASSNVQSTSLLASSNQSRSSLQNPSKKRRVCQEDLMQMQMEVLREQKAMFVEQKRLAEVQLQREKKEIEKLDLQKEFIRFLREECTTAPLTNSQANYIAAMSVCLE